MPDLTAASSILVVSCVNDTGAGLGAVMDWISGQEGGKQILSAAVYSSPKAIIQPDFVGREIMGRGLKGVDRLLTAMPWMVSGWRHDLPNERGKRGK
ncbi:hypothetical protein Rhe02_38100 [Rhizocola hellebori]|uniref:Uncharacterized protein n=1 Tax=Rhizocola hellebori TaxID=1392758 RepID=A0A8J3VHB5_9ACTN|nr:hypothetical protein Rhe02_38100 [Rhizocola hellebori]